MIFWRLLTYAFVFLTLHAFAGPQPLTFDKSILSNCSVKFMERPNAVAINVHYESIQKSRVQIETVIGRPLKFLTGWDPKGEAHVTVITPPELEILKAQGVSADSIQELARKTNLQCADVRVLGVGSAKRQIVSRDEETFFLVVDSSRLREFRYTIYERYIERGGDPRSFDPAWYFPHITLGYTREDLHETQGVLKNIKATYDDRFRAVLQ